MKGQGEGLPKKCYQTCLSAALLVGDGRFRHPATANAAAELPNAPMRFLVEDELLVEVVLAVGGCNVADLKVGGKALFVVLSDVVDGGAWWSHWW